MCYDADASPPVHDPPVTAVASEQLTLTSADGTQFAGFQSRPNQDSGVGVLVLPDNRGLSGFYERLTVRLAERGYAALAVDYFGRTAGPGYRDRGADFVRTDHIMTHLARLTKEGLYADFEAGIARLGCDTVVSLGCCLGGRFAFMTSAPRFGLAGAIGLYGALGPIHGAPGPIQLAGTYRAPILGLFGGADEGIPPTAVAAFDDALTAAGVPHEIVTYPGAPHGFFELQQRQFPAEQRDVWQRILRFVGDRAKR